MADIRVNRVRIQKKSEKNKRKINFSGMTWKFLREVPYEQWRDNPPKLSINKCATQKKVDFLENIDGVFTQKSDVMKYLDGDHVKDNILNTLMDEIKESKRASELSKPSKKEPAKSDQAELEVPQHEFKEIDAKTLICPKKEDDEDQDTTPEVYWRPHARVRLVTDIPKEMWSECLARQHENAMDRVSELESKMDEKLVYVTPNEPVNSPKKSPGPRKARRTKLEYGAWYIPPDKWHVRRFNDNHPNEFSTKVVPAIDYDATAKNNQVALEKLIIGDQFRAYLKQNGYRLPQCLAKRRESR